MRYKPKYELTYNNETLDISKIVDSRETTISRHLCTTDFKSAIDKATFTVKYSPDEKNLRASIMNFLYGSMETLEDIKVEISLNEYSLFKGYLDLSELKLSSKRLPESIKLSANDISAKLLDRRVDEYVYLENQKISDIVKHLVAMAGGTFDLNYLQRQDDRVIPVFTIDKDEDDNTYRNYIDTLLFEAGGYVLDTDEEGKMSIQSLPWESVETTRTVDDFQLDKGIETTRRFIDKNGLKLTWSTLAETNKNQRVWTAEFSRKVEGKVLKGVDIPSGGYYPENGDIEPIYQKFNADFLDREYLTKQNRQKNEDLSIIAVRDVSAQITTLDANDRELSITDAWEFPVLPSLKMPANPTVYAKKAWYLLKNKTNQTVNLQIFTLEGRVLYRSKINHLTIPANASKLQEYTSTYIFTAEHAQRFAQFYWHFLKYSSTVHRWSCLGDVSLGEVVGIQHKGASKAQATLIVSASLSFVGNTSKVSCTGVAVGAYEEYETESYSEAEIVRPPAPTPAMFLQLSGLTYRYDSKGQLLPGNKIITAEVKNVDKYSPIHWKINGELLETQETVIEVPPSYMAHRDFIEIEVSLDAQKITNSIVRVMDGADYIPVVQYRYSSSADTPDTDYSGISYNKGNNIYPISYNGLRVVYGDEPWTVTVPAGDQYVGKYLWKRTWSYKINSWLYERINDISIAFDVYPSSYTYPINKRATEEITIGFTVRAQGITGTVAYAASAGEFRNGTLFLPANITNKKVTVTVTCKEMVRIIDLLGVETEDNAPVYGGILETAPTGKTPIDGDYYMSSAGVPMRFNGTTGTWEELKTYDANHAEILKKCGEDWNAHGKKIEKTMSAVYGCFQQLYSDSVVAESIDTDSLKADSIDGAKIKADSIDATRIKADSIDATKIKAGSVTADKIDTTGLEVEHLKVKDTSKKFKAEIKGDDTTPAVFDVQYDRGNGLQTIFKIVPSSGKIFMGKPNADATAPESGFMYDPDTDTISTVAGRFKVRTDGSLYAENGIFKGQFDCDSIYTEKIDVNPRDLPTVVNNANQVKDFFERYYPEYFWEQNKSKSSPYIRCTIQGAGKPVRYFVLSSVLGGWATWNYMKITFYDVECNQIPINEIWPNAVGWVDDKGGVHYEELMYGTLINTPTDVYIPTGFTITLYEGGNLLLLRVPESPAPAEIAKMLHGQMYCTSDGTLKMSIKE